ncbi:MFS transporter [Paraburkholderia sp. NPDC080076]|uniref:MFS transporter n=1 Tax=Paraburkholderia sp. NPDC080076 TaxID=3390605 RepID=UPI003D0415C9
MATGESSFVSVGDYIEAQETSARQVLLLVLAGSVIFLDGLNTQSISVVTKSMSIGLGIGLSKFGLVYAALQGGGIIGTFMVGYFGDRYGRKMMVAGSAFAIAIISLMTAYATTIWELTVLRFLIGIALGGAFPSVMALGSEYVRASRRATIVSVLLANYSLGAATGAIVNGYVLRHYHWQAVFLADGCASLTIAVITLIFLRESPHYLYVKGEAAAAGRALRYLFPSGDRFSLRPPAPFVPACATSAPRAPLNAIFSENRAGATIALLAVLATSQATIKVMTVWLTPLQQAAGVSIRETSYILASLDVGSMLGLGFAGYIVTLLGPRKLLGPSLILLSLATAAIAFFMHSFAAVIPAGFVIGFAGGLGQSAPLALIAATYATEIRSTALGVGNMSKQVGSMLSPLLVGFLVALGWKSDSILYVVAAIPLIGILFFVSYVRRSAMRQSGVPAAQARDAT